MARRTVWGLRCAQEAPGIYEGKSGGLCKRRSGKGLGFGV